MPVTRPSHRLPLRALVAIAAAIAVVAGLSGRAAATTVVKIGTLAPVDSLWAREFKKLAARAQVDRRATSQPSRLLSGLVGVAADGRDSPAGARVAPPL